MPDRHQITFVLVEDDEVDVRVFRRIVASLPNPPKIVVAENGADALDLLKGCNGRRPPPHPFVLFLDMQIPRMSGLEVLDAIRSDPELLPTLVFGYSGSDHRRDINDAYDGSIAGYLVKLMRVGEFKEKLLKIHEFLSTIELPETA